MFIKFEHPDDPAPPMPVAMAVARGQRVVNRPVKLMIAAGVILALVGFQRSPWWVAAAPLGWILGWCWWSYAAPRWRRWAIGRGVDPRALQYFGEKARLLWPKGHWGERTELGDPAEREALQPKSPVRSHPDVIAETTNLSPGFFGPPSNQSFLLNVVYWAAVLPAGMAILNLFMDIQPVGPGHWFTGLTTGIQIAAFSYHQLKWREVVDPAHALGLGVLGVAIIVAGLLNTVVPVGPLLIALSLFLLIGPVYLTVAAVAEWKRRSSTS